MTTHGCRATKPSPEYRTWAAMKSRCNNPKNTNYPRYGGRGIRVCDQWVDSFEEFLAAMGPKPSPAHTIERVNNDGNYEPNNCRWATMKEQSGNRSNTRPLTLNGETLSVDEWAERLGTTANTLRSRLHSGWTPERTLTEPIAKDRRLLTLQGETLPLLEWAHRKGLDPATIRTRLNTGWSVQAALTTPER